MPKVMLEGYRCERCSHQWLPRSTTEGDPTICPKCKSPYWNKPRINNKVNNPKVKQPKVEVRKNGRS
jgi:DNA-directed RNA polymerase subunit RPC12/RpoP